MIRRCLVRLAGLWSAMKNKNPFHTDEQLTPELCRQLSESFADLPPQFQLSPEDLELMEEEIHRNPMRYGTPAEAIAAMERRISQLRQDKIATLETLEDCDDAVRSQAEKALADYEEQLRIAERRLEAYRFQLGREN
jgi:hypothetical protein